MTHQYQTEMNVELDHIVLELGACRLRHHRHFIDSYFCYRHQYLNRNGHPKWNDILWSEYVSEGADKLRSASGYTAVTRDHVVPLSHIRQKLLNIPQPNRESIASVLDTLTIHATISKKEDQTLRDCQLNDKMPEGFDVPGDAFFQNRFARYEVAGIKLLPRVER